MKVLKFGGTSVAGAGQMSGVCDIIRRHTGQTLVVASACSGITDRIISIINSAVDAPPGESRTAVELIALRHHEIIESGLENSNIADAAHSEIDRLAFSLAELAEGVYLLGECTLRTTDAALALGELMSTVCLDAIARSRGIDSQLLDARKFMKTDGNFGCARPDLNQIESKISKYINNSDSQIFITQGFIGSDSRNRTTTLGRGGSDYSAALMAAAAGAEEIQIWTDVSGVMSADPRIVPEAHTIARMSLAEVRELSFYGAKVLHPDTLIPATRRGIPVRVLNASRPADPGTLILGSTGNSRPAPHAITMMKDCLMLAPQSGGGSDEFARAIGEISTAGAAVLSAECSASNFSIIIKKEKFSGDKPVAGTARKLGLGSRQCSLVCVSGENLYSSESANGHILGKIARLASEYQPIAFLKGRSDNSIIIVLNENSDEEVVRGLHRGLFGYSSSSL
ncbi:MAG: aspartate kinase [Candidatus Kapaibacterium sp.]